MQTVRFIIKVAFATIALYCSAGLLHAQGASPGTQRDREGAQASRQEASRAELIRIVGIVADRYKVKITLDPEIRAGVRLRAPAEDVPLTVALESLTKQIDGAVWRRVYLEKDVVLPPPERFVASVRAQDRLPSRALVVEKPLSQLSAVFLPQSRTPAFDRKRQAGPWQSDPIYLLYNNAAPADGQTILERLVDLQQRQLDLMANLTPDQLPNPALLGLTALQNMDPARREAFLQTAGAAGMQAWQSTPSDVRDQMIQQFVGVIMPSSPAAQNSAAGGGATAQSGPAPMDGTGELRQILAALAKRFHTPILLDPALHVSGLPAPPPAGLTLDQAIESVTKSLHGVTWRRVYVRPSTPPVASAIPSLTDLVAAIRRLEKADRNALLVENPATQRMTTFRANIDADAMRETLTAERFSPKPIYILFPIQETPDSTQPAEAQLADVLRAQLAMIQNMDSEQLTQLMTQQIEQYQNQNANEQISGMRLPVAAMLMAVWMPQQAKQQKSGP